MEDEMVGRRGAERFTIECPAKLHLGNSAHVVWMLNISRTGACILARVPAGEIQVRLQWQCHDCPASVVWSAPPLLGLRFETSLPAEIVSLTRTLGHPKSWEDPVHGVEAAG